MKIFERQIFTGEICVIYQNINTKEMYYSEDLIDKFDAFINSNISWEIYIAGRLINNTLVKIHTFKNYKDIENIPKYINIINNIGFLTFEKGFTIITRREDNEND